MTHSYPVECSLPIHYTSKTINEIKNNKLTNKYSQKKTHGLLKDWQPYNLFKSACPVPTYLAWRCSSWELMLNLSLACTVQVASSSNLKLLKKFNAKASYQRKIKKIKSKRLAMIFKAQIKLRRTPNIIKNDTPPSRKQNNKSQN